MSFKGTFHVTGYSPDGDSIRFKADNDEHWDKIFGRVDLNAKGHAQLRIEAIDTLETHFMNENTSQESWQTRQRISFFSFWALKMLSGMLTGQRSCPHRTAQEVAFSPAWRRKTAGRYLLWVVLKT